MVKFTSEIRFPPNLKLDLTEEMVEAAGIIAEEIRGNIKRGSDPSEEVSHTLNAPDYAKLKIRKLGHQKPLIAFYKKLIEKSSYVIRRESKNNVTLRLSQAQHPKSSASIAQIGAWNQNGTNSIPPRPFFKVSLIARKRVIGRLADKIRGLVRGKA